MRILFAIGWTLAGAVLIFAAVLGAHRSGYIVVFPEQKYQIELASLFLVAATLIITTIAILLAVVAAVGYTALRDAAITAGRGAGEAAARELLAAMVQREVAAHLAAQGLDRTEELTEALAARGDDVRPPQN